MQAVRRTIRRSPIRLRVALMATAVAFAALAAVMYQHIAATSATFDQTARQQALTGGAALRPALLDDLEPLVAAARRDGRPLQQYRGVADGGRSSRRVKNGLSPWSSPDTLIVTAVRQKDGSVLVTGHPVTRAVARLRSSAISTGLVLLAGGLIIAVGLMLLLGRLVTRPLERLTAEV